MVQPSHDYFEVVEYRVRVIEAVGCPACGSPPAEQCTDDGAHFIDYVHDFRSHAYDRLRSARNVLNAINDAEGAQIPPMPGPALVYVTSDGDWVRADLADSCDDLDSRERALLNALLNYSER